MYEYDPISSGFSRHKSILYELMKFEYSSWMLNYKNYGFLIFFDECIWKYFDKFNSGNWIELAWYINVINNVIYIQVKCFYCMVWKGD